jgi:hypothetical protein
MKIRGRLPRLSPLALAALAAAALVSGCGEEGDSKGPRALLEEASAKPIESADVSMTLDANVPNFPILASRWTVAGGGPIAAKAGDALPTLDWRLSLEADGQEFPTRLRAVDDRVFLDFMGLSYEADPDLVGNLRAEDERPAGGISLEQLGVDPGDWLRNLRVEDGEEIGGDSTRRVTGKVDVSAVVDDVLGALESSGVADQIGGMGGDAPDLRDLSGQDRERIEGAVRAADVEVDIDDEGYPRRSYAKLRFVMPKEVEGTAIEGGTLTFELVLDEVGDVEVDVAAPAAPRPLESLFRLVGVVFGIDEPSDLWREQKF